MRKFSVRAQALPKSAKAAARVAIIPSRSLKRDEDFIASDPLKKQEAAKKKRKARQTQALKAKIRPPRA